jgi:hypothetical protein
MRAGCHDPSLSVRGAARLPVAQSARHSDYTFALHTSERRKEPIVFESAVTGPLLVGMGGTRPLSPRDRCIRA